MSLGPRTLVSGVIVLVLGLQVISIITWSGRYTWPFTDYPMYARSQQEGDRVVGRHILYAVLEDGREIEITPDDLGGNVFVFQKWIGALQLERPGLQVSSDDRRAANKRLTDNRQSWPLRNWLTSTYLFRVVKAGSRSRFAVHSTHRKRKRLENQTATHRRYRRHRYPIRRVQRASPQCRD